MIFKYNNYINFAYFIFLEVFKKFTIRLDAFNFILKLIFGENDFETEVFQCAKLSILLFLELTEVLFQFVFHVQFCKAMLFPLAHRLLAFPLRQKNLASFQYAFEWLL